MAEQEKADQGQPKEQLKKEPKQPTVHNVPPTVPAPDDPGYVEPKKK